MNDKPEDDIDTPNPFRKYNICIYCDVFVDYIALGICVPKTKTPRDKAPLLSAKLIANNCDLLYLIDTCSAQLQPGRVTLLCFICSFQWLSLGAFMTPTVFGSKSG